MPVSRRDAIRTVAGAALGAAAAGIAVDIGAATEARLEPGLCHGSAVTGFDPYCFHDGTGKTHQIHVVGASGPPVVLLHELPGLVTDDLQAGKRIAALGYTVVMPLFFGKAGLKASRATTTLNSIRVCDRGEFDCNGGTRSSPHLAWLRPLIRAVRARWTDGRGLGVIGMCLTGAFPVALLCESAVAAVVVCQPTLPVNVFSRLGWFTDGHALAISPADLENAKNQSDAPILGVRYASDWRCPPERFERLTHEFGSRFYRMDLSGTGHSTLGHSFCPEAFDEVASFLARFAGGGSQPATRVFPTLSKNNSSDQVLVTCHEQHT